MHDRQIGRPHLDLLELVRGLIEHLQLEVHAAKRHRQGYIVRRSRDRLPVDRDHAGRAAFFAVGAFQAGQHG